MNPLLEQEYLNKINEYKKNAKRYYDSGDYAKASEELFEMQQILRDSGEENRGRDKKERVLRRI